MSTTHDSSATDASDGSIELHKRAPAGFCPKCYYPIDPGTCPECGTLVTDQSILSSLSQTRAAKLRRWAFRILVFVILPVAAIYGAWRVPWPRLMPTRLLLSLQSDSGDWISGELLDRFVGGKLTATELNQFLDRAVMSDLLLRTVAPSGSRAAYGLKFQFNIPHQPSASAKLELTHELVVDGIQQIGIGWHSEGREYGVDYLAGSLPGLAAGPHHVRFDLAFSVSANSSSGVPVRYSWKRSIARTIDCVNRTAGEFIEMRCDPAMTSTIMSKLKTKLVDGNICINGYPSIPVAGRLQLRVPGQDEFEDLGPVLLGAGDSNIACGPLGRFKSSLFLNVRILPDPAVALEQLDKSFQQFFGCTLEWEIRNDDAPFETGTSKTPR